MNSTLGKTLASIIALSVVIIWAGCSKKDSANSAPSGTDSAANQPAPSPTPNGPAPAANNPVSSPALAEAQAAMKAKDYEKAASVMVNLQRQPLTPEQAQVVRGQMVQFQRDLAAGVASGDPKAKAAAELLRQSAMR